MSQERLNHTMLLYVHKDRTDQLDIASIARLSEENQTKMNFFFEKCNLLSLIVSNPIDVC